MFIQCLPYLLDWWLRFYLATISAKRKAASKGKAKVPCVHDTALLGGRRLCHGHEDLISLF